MPRTGFRGHHTQEARLKMSAVHLGVPFTSEHKAKIAEALRGEPLTEERRLKISIARQKPCPDINKIEKLYCQDGYSLAEIGEIFNVAHKLVKRWLLQTGISLRIGISNRTRNRISITRKGQPPHPHFWRMIQDPEIIRKRFLGRFKRPTKPERQLSELLTTNSLPYRYVGNGEVIFGGKNPDYINIDGQKKLIELFGIYWHDPFDVAKRTEHFRQYGFDTLIIWEDELKEPEKVVAKIKSFNRRRLSHGEAGLCKAPVRPC